MLDFFSSPIAGKLFRIALILGGALLAKGILVRFLNSGLAKIDHNISQKVKRERLRTLGSVLSNLSSFVLGALALLLVLSELGVDIAPLLAGLGVLGLGVGLAAQTLIRDYISGFFILFENQFNVGDRVEIGGKKGEVVDLSLRTTTLKDAEGRIHLVPNSQISAITKFSRTTGA